MPPAKFTTTADYAANNGYADSIIRSFCGNGKIFIAGNISDKKDLAAVSHLANKFKGQKFIFVPREIYEEWLNEIMASIEGKSLLCSQCDRQTDFNSAQVLIIDFLGSQPWIYRYGTYAYIGGGFSAANDIATYATGAITHGLPTAFGPHANVGAHTELSDLGVCKSVRSRNGLCKWFAGIKDNQGKLQKIKNAAIGYKLKEGTCLLSRKQAGTRNRHTSYAMLLIFVKALSHVPFRMIYILSDGLFLLMYHVARYRRKIARRNLTEALPEKNLHEIKILEKRFYRFFSDLMLESCKLATMTQGELMQRMEFKGIEAVNATLREHKSVAIYLGHYGNWEWVSSLPLWLEKDTISAQIYHRLSNKGMDRLMKHIRERMGAVCVDMHKTAIYATRLGKSGHNGVIGFIADQAPRMKDAHYFLDFLNHDVPVLAGVEKIIRHCGLAAFYLDVKRTRRGHYEAQFVKMAERAKDLPDLEMTTLYYRHLEQSIARQPELYLWTHNRFRNARKTRDDAHTNQQNSQRHGH